MNTTTQEFEPECIPSYDEIVAFDPDEFATAFQRAMNAVSVSAVFRDPATFRITLPDVDGRALQYGLADEPQTGIILAMWERYGTVDPTKGHSAVARVFALLHFVSQGGLEPWVSKAPGRSGDMYIDARVIAAAAVVGLDEHLQFPVREMMRQVRQLRANGGQ
jgi:hypothetical protein